MNRPIFKLNGKQKEVIDVLTKNISYLKSSNDLDSPSKYSDLSEELENMDFETEIDTEIINDLVECYSQILELVRKI